MAGELGFRAWITTSAFLKVCTILAAFVVHTKGVHEDVQKEVRKHEAKTEVNF